MGHTKPKLDARTRFNVNVLSILDDIAPDHADALRSRGITLGWWHTVDFGRTSGKTVRETALMVASSPLD